jgi:aspartyl-tRNA(Asn)/glutamyl-tRNA(Gln) amidotransferase subunit A
MTDANELCRMDTVTLARRIRAKELSPVKVIEAVLGRLERLDPVLHAFTTVTADDARAEARRIKQDIAAGREVGPLAGVPTGVKDLICTKGVRTASGCYAYADFVPDEDDVVVERINAAGAIVIGKTQVPEFGYSGTGQTPLAEPTANPWRLDRTSGGSSAGSGAAVAAGIGPFSLGSDGGGSVRIRRAFAAYAVSRRRWAGCRCIRVPRTSATGGFQLGVTGAHRPDYAHRRRRGACPVGHRRA